MSRDPEEATAATRFGRLTHLRSFPAEAAFEAISLHRAALAEPAGQVLKRSSETSVTVVQVRGVKVCVKEFHARGALHALKDFIRPSPPRRSWWAGRMLEALGLPAPQCLALLLRRPWDLGGSSFLIMSALEDVEGIDAFARRRLPEMSFAQRKDAVRRAAVFLRLLHHARVFHSDLKVSNLLVRERDDKLAFFLVDLAAVRRPWKLTRGHVTRNMAQLHASMPNVATWTDRLRFFRAYRGDDAWADDDRAALAEVGRRTALRNTDWDK